jgi:hypothetical protein
MKKLILLMATVLNLSLWAGDEISEANVPELIFKKFYKQYPTVSTVRWEKVERFYEVFFVENGKSLALSYDSSGRIKRQDCEIEATELPGIYLQKIKDLYANDFKIAKVFLKGYGSKNPTYLVTIQHGSINYRFTFEYVNTDGQSMYIQRVEEVD